MLYALSTQHPKKIAYSLLLIFYANIVSAGVVNMNSTTGNSFVNSYSFFTKNKSAAEITVPPQREKHININKYINKKHEQLIDQEPTVLHGSDPGQPEMQSFKSVGTDNMVDLFTGDFSYNIPLLDVGGYPVNIFYNSGVSMDQEASWVGLGWNINPGTVSRNMRGLPDDFNGSEQITKKQNIKDDITVGANVGGQGEIIGFPFGSLSISQGLFYNNYKGFGLEASFGLSISDKTKDEMTGGVSPTAFLNYNINSQNGATLSPSLGINIYNKDNATKTGIGASIGYNSRVGIQNLQLAGEMTRYAMGKQATLLNGSISFARPAVTPSIRMPISRSNYSLGFSVGPEFFLSYGSAFIKGYYTQSGIAAKDRQQSKPAYGYLYMDKGQQDDNALMDFNRINDGQYTLQTPVISMPNYTYDVYTVSGEGTGGTFRPYRSDIGYVKDHYSKTRDNSFSIDAEVGGGNAFEVGGNFHAVFSPTEVQEWKAGNLAANALKFHANDSIYQAVYFKNPAEKTIGNEAFIQAVGGDDLVKIKLANTNNPYPNTLPVLEKYGNNKAYKDTVILTPERTIKKARDKRSQIISYLTAQEAARIGLERDIISYPLNTFPIGSCTGTPAITHILRVDNSNRKAHHISEISVLNSDGRRYIYGVPVYNLYQEETSFATDQSVNADQTVNYKSSDNSTDNSAGRDHYYQQQSVPAYAHSFLLTGLLSPDYVDVKGDGITEDDKGDAVKFNYTQMQKDVLGNTGFNWRAPMAKENNVASVNEGLKTDNKDNKASYTYGQRELWYMNSIESKNMVATFTISNRDDGKEALSTNGAIGTTGMKKLDRIDLYSKADYIKATTAGKTPKPIKTVHFEYTYQLCAGVPSNSNNGGKLTLKSIWFSYNGNIKQIKNKYIFTYNNNPNYNRSYNDRWGTYKPATANPAGMNNMDYPYAPQDKTQADQYASAWALSELQLPSGGKMNVTYESDDYAYVQNRRAAQMFAITGFGNTKTAAPSSQLYTNSGDHFYVFVDIKTPTRDNELVQKYFEGVKQVYLRMAVKMPSDAYGSGYETIPVYAEINEYGMVPGNDHLLYIKVKPIDNNVSPMASSAIRFLRDYLPSKAYPGSDIKLENGPKSVLLALNGMVQAVKNTFSDFENKTARRKNYCNDVNLSQSFIRLNNPSFQKLGGGLRVKKIEITDNFKLMNQKSPDGKGEEMQAATYGQEYDYTTTTNLNGKTIAISSGVATYEPGIGAEENPFREVLHYSDKQPLGPTQAGAIEVPIGEMFYPSPMVGYSKVTVRSINRNNVKSGVGRQVTEFYTSKDFPVLSDLTDFDGNSRVRYRSNPILQLLHLDARQTITLSQGFRVQINDMNGKMKSQSAYSEDSSQLISYTANYYRLQKNADNTYSFNNKILATTGADGNVVETSVGKDIEVMADFREHRSETVTTNIDVNVNASVFGIFPVIVPSLVPPVYYEQSLYRSASIVKIINTYAILDSVVSIDKGSQVSTKDLVYDGETGNVLLTRTSNEFNDPIYHFIYPAHWAYSGMHPAYKNIDLTYKGVNFRHGRIVSGTPVNMTYFESGDELYVVDDGESLLYDTDACFLASGGSECSTKSKILSKSFENRIWALDITKDKKNTIRQFIFIDRNGTPYNADNVTLKIVRSGKRNLLNQSVGNVTCRINPLTTVGSQQKIILQNTNEVIHTSANTFKDNWRVDNAFYAKDSIVKTTIRARIKRNSYQPEDFTNVSYYNKGADRIQLNCAKENFLYLYNWYKNPTLFRKSEKRMNRGFLLYNFASNPIPASAITYRCLLSLYAHTNDIYRTSSADHFGIHGSAASQDINQPGEIRALTKEWLGVTPTCSEWTNYFVEGSPNLSSVSNILPGATSGNSSYYRNGYVPVSDTRIDITNVFNANTGTVLHAQKKLGLQLSLYNDYVKRDEARRCFWGSFYPRIDYYYYVCGDTSIQRDPAPLLPNTVAPAPDPLLNMLIDCETRYIPQTFCLSKFTNKQINPYVLGVLGNWRTDKAYTYYGSRRDSAIGITAIDIRKAGAINNFLPYWTMNKDSLKSPAANSLWVWNSETTQFNRRGFEIENRDPLGRYNAGLYGYAQALPTAIANNASLREIAFDGFEDYSYQSSSCNELCKPRRHVNIENAKNILADTVSHTGKYSIAVIKNQAAVINIPVTDTSTDAKLYALRVKLDSIKAIKTTVMGKGIGLTSYYYNDEWWRGSPIDTLIVPTINWLYRQKWDLPSPRLTREDFSVQWLGWIQPKYTGIYRFRLVYNDQFDLIINGKYIFKRIESEKGHHDITVSADLIKGVLYPIQVSHNNWKGGDYSAQLFWSSECQPMEIVPATAFYPKGRESLGNGTVKTDTLWCVRPDSIQVRGNALTDTFSLIKGKKMIISAWVKEGNVDCKCADYTHNQIQISFPGSISAITTITPKGNIIEGWQRYEGVFTVPSDAGPFSCKIQFLNTSTTSDAVYFDDIRIHPYNANMKSFVYHPSNLRLMAELDENNYATFYEYDDDGTLVRVKKETIQGIKTINETRSSLQKAIQ